MLYYNNATLDSEWNTLGNWWNDAVFSDPALALPTAGDDLEIWQPVLTVNTGIGVPYAQSVTVQTTGYLTQAIYNFVGGTLPYSISFFGVTAWVTDTYYVAGRPSPLPESGTGYWFGQGYFIAGVVTLLPESGTGWDAILNDYFIAGVATAGALDQYGNGIYGGLYYTSYPTLADGWQFFQSVGGYDYYFAGVATSGGLDSSGNGFYAGHAYYNGALQPNGWNNLHYYIADVAVDGFDSGGYGLYNGIYYGGYPTLANGNYPYWVTNTLLNNKFYLEGAETTLETSGSGIYLWLVYSGGVPVPTGYIWTNDGTAGYYIDNVHTDLDYSGNGTWETRNYFGGVSAGQPGTDTRWLMWNGNNWSGYWYDANNWTLYSNADWSGNYATAGVGPTSVDNCLIPDYTLPVSQLNYTAQCNNITVQYNGNYWGFYRVYGGPLIVNGTATITGTNTFPMSGTGTANFTGSGKNIENITFGAINFRDSSYNTVNTGGWSCWYGVCNVASFYDNATNAGGTYGTGLDITAGYAASQYGYYCGVVTGASSFYNNSINYGGCLGVATFYNNAKNMLGLNGGVILSYNKGINGTGILGIF